MRLAEVMWRAMRVVAYDERVLESQSACDGKKFRIVFEFERSLKMMVCGGRNGEELKEVAVGETLV